LETVGTPWLWAGFTALVVALLSLDLGIFQRKAREVCFHEALTWSVVWVALALLSNVGCGPGSVRRRGWSSSPAI
jgi:tellurite resistance protein TerC